MTDTKVIFVAFAIEDERQRDLLKGQSLNTKSPFEYTDMSVKEAYSSEWKECHRTLKSGHWGTLQTRPLRVAGGQYRGEPPVVATSIC